MASRVNMLIACSYFLLVSACSSAEQISGAYHGNGNWYVEITQAEGGRYYLTVGDISQGGELCESDSLLLCLSFNMVELIVPSNLSVGRVTEWNSSKVSVEKYYESLNFGATSFQNVYLLNVTRGKYVKVNGKPKLRSSVDREFELIYSKAQGLLGFRELPSARADYFLVDWRSLEARDQ